MLRYSAQYIIGFSTCLLCTLGCQPSPPLPRSVWSPAERHEADVREMSKTSGPPLLKVVARDTGEPVADVFVGMTLIGADGGDGGFHRFLTRDDGVALLHHPISPGRYQPHLEPSPASRYVHTEWSRGDPYVVVGNDGSSSIPVLRLDVR